MFENLRSRRNFFRSTAAFAGGLLASLGPVRRVWAAPFFINDPFQLGVASGDPVADGFVIWTRLAPDLFDPQALPDEAIAVAWEVATDDKMKKVVARGQEYARPELAHSVHVDVMGLEPARPYFYRFSCGGAVSPIGRAVTLPVPGNKADRLKFALASCQHFQQGYFTPYRDMVAQDPNLIVHVGDYIYEVSYGLTVRQHPVYYARSLDEYRLIHAVYKTDPDLQAAHRQCPWIVTWDDHEVDNDYARNESQFGEDPAEFEKRRLAAYQAFYEHMPLRAQARRNANGDMILYQRLNYGNLIEFNVLDLRQWRSNQACESPDWMSGRVLNVEDCAEFADPARTMLGKDQERWMQMQFAKTGAKWTVIVQSLMLSAFDQVNGPGRGFYTDNWGGYPAARRKVLDLIKARQPANVVSLGGDIHSYFVSEIRDDDSDPNSPTLLTEFVTTSITSESYNTEIFNALLPENPHIKFCDDRYRGYVMCDVTPGQWRAELRVMDTVRTREGKASTLKSFVIEDGRPRLEIS